MTTITEIWKSIPNYENYYQISNLGRVKALSRTVWNGRGMAVKKERILKQAKSYCGDKRNNKRPYYVVNLSKNNKQKTHSVHRLVAENFLENPNNLPQINHKDTNTENNHYTNLEWCTNSENQAHRHKHGLHTPNAQKGKQNRRSKPIECYTIDMTLIESYESVGEASRELGIARSGIFNCANGKLKTFHSMIWRYKNTMLS